MGISASGLAALNMLARDKQFDNVKSIFEIGAQEVDASKYEDLLAEVFRSFGKEQPSRDRCQYLTTAPARDFFSELGLSYFSLDTTAEHGAAVIDLNFDSAPLDHRGRHDLVTNFGTTEHAFNQHNCFNIVHDLTKPGGLMIHHVPLRGIYDTCFYNYHPELFICLARANGYEILGMWIDIGGNLPYLLPWSPDYFQFVTFTEQCNMHIFVAMRKLHDNEFNVPYQRQYEQVRSDEAAARYKYTLPNGQIANGYYLKQIAVMNDIAQPGKIPFSMLRKIIMREFLFRLRRRFSR